MKGALREKIASEITLSDYPGKTIRKWREELEITQHELSKFLELSPSVISDYESGRRKSPGTKTVRKIVDALLELDKTRKSSLYFAEPDNLNEIILSMKDFPVGLSPSIFLKKIQGVNLSKAVPLVRNIHGYTVLDSLKTITTLRSSDYWKIYGWSTERALVFTGVKFGRSPMVAVRAHPLKPAMVVYVRPERVDPLAVKLAELENVTLVRTQLSKSEVVSRLEAL
ncbi:MAG: helix-turn-helix domain-containing protein [Methanomassiliicoccales archaeon]|nr:MAG: helix-turn-helix domain-containing protein [Methanomassiliicoccales archaeon]